MALSFTLPGRKVSTSSSNVTTTTQNRSADLGLIRGVVGDILGFQAKGVEYGAAASAQRTNAAGYDAEVAAYQGAERVSNLNAEYAGISGDIRAIQAQREALRAIGGQKASIAAAGFASGGQAADMVRSSLQQSYLAQQIIRTQANFDKAGYLEQAAASRAQAGAAEYAKTATLNTAGVYDWASQDALTRSANMTAGLSGYLQKFNLPNTTAEGLISGADIGMEIATAPQITSTDTTGSTSQGKETFVAAPGTRSKFGYYKGLEDSPFGITTGSGNLASPDRLQGTGLESPTTSKVTRALGEMF